MVAVAVKVRKSWGLDESLKGIDALCERWAIQTKDYYGGSASSIWKIMREREGAGMSGGGLIISADVLCLESVLVDAEDRYLLMVKVWYGSTSSVDQKAKRLGMSRTELYGQWRRTLEYLRGRLHAIGVNV